jgi:sugar lactone lactonase YvrE
MNTIHPCNGWPAVPRLVREFFSCTIRGALSATAFLLLLSPGMQAQTVHFGYALSTLGSGYSQPTYAALDASGNLFVTDEGTASVYELTVSSGYSTVITLSTAFTIPTGIAVDANENVFVTDQGTATVNELTAASGYATAITLGSGFSNPNGVAVDANGDVFVADTLNNAIKEMLAVNGSIPPNPTINTLGGSYNHATSVAVDSSGNVFVADLFNSAVKEIVAAGGYTTVNTLGSGFSYPAGVAIDASDNVYVADSGNGAIKEILATGGYNTVNTLVSGLPYSTGVAVNSAGNVFIASFSGSAVFELTLFGATGFGSLPVATQTPETIALNFIFDTGGTIGTPAVLTRGAPGLDFTDAGTGTCTTNGTSHSYNPGDSCSVAVTFTPKYSGNRYGAVTLSNGSGIPIAMVYVLGIGIGPQVSFSPATLTALHGGFNAPLGIAIDGSGNVYIAQESNNPVQEILATGGYTTVNTLGSGFNSPEGVAVDGGGNVFVADTVQSQVKEILAGGGYTVINTLGSGLSHPDSIAVDGIGNVFVGNTGSGAVIEIPVAAGYSTVITLASGFVFPLGIAVDSSGNVFVADVDTNLVSEIIAAGGYATVRTLGSGFNEPAGIAVDGEGNVFVSDYGNGAIKEILVAGGYTTVNTVGSGLDGPIGVAVDGAGNIFFADSITNTIKQLNVVNPPALSFATTVAGSTSSDSPKAVTLVNNGNAALTFEVPTTGLNPSVAAGFSFSGSSSCPQVSSSSSAATLAAGASCVAAVSFTPTVAGSITGSMVITDNSRNAPGPTYTTQSVGLSGTATPPPVTAMTAIGAVTLTQNHAATPFIPVTGSGGNGTLTYSILPALPPGLVFSTATGTISGDPTVVRAAATYTVTVTDQSAATASAPFSLTVNTAVAALTAVTSKALTQNHAATAFVPVTGSGGTSPLIYSIAPALPAGLILSSATGAVTGTPTAISATATYTVTVTDSNGATSSATFSLTVNPAVAAATAIASVALTQNHAPAPFIPVSGSGGTGTLTYSISPSLPAGLNISSSTGTVAGTPTIVSATATYTVTITDSNGASASSTFALAVDSITATATAVMSSNLTPLFGSSIVLTATVTPAPTGSVLGTVSFYNGTTLLGMGNLNSSGVTTFSTTSLPAGVDGLTAVYSGNVGFAASTSSVLTETVTAVSSTAPTTTALTASPNPAEWGVSITFTATISPTPTGTPTGTVSFYIGTTLLGSSEVNSSGIATFTISSLPSGSDSIKAVYSGNAGFAGSTSSAESETVNTTYTVTGPKAPVTAQQGGSGTIDLNVPPLGGAFNSIVTMSATGLPPGATGTFNPATVTPGSAGAPTVLTIQLAALAASTVDPHRTIPFAGFIFAMGVCGIGFKHKRFSRGFNRAISLVVLACATSSLIACGGGFFGPPSTQPGSYVVTITGTSGSTHASTTVTVVVQ